MNLRGGTEGDSSEGRVAVGVTSQESNLQPVNNFTDFDGFMNIECHGNIISSASRSYMLPDELLATHPVLDDDVQPVHGERPPSRLEFQLDAVMTDPAVQHIDVDRNYFCVDNDTDGLVGNETDVEGDLTVPDVRREVTTVREITSLAPPHHCHHNIDFTVDRTARNQLIIVSVLCFAFMIAEITGGLLSNSLALVSDATHLASDLAGFIASLVAIWLATKRPTPRMTLGYHRAEVIGAFISILIIWVVTAVVFYMAVKRIINKDYDINGTTMLITASMGLVFNLIMGLVLHSTVFRCCRLPHSAFGHNHSHGGHSHGGHNHEGHSHGGHNHEGHSHGSHSHGGDSLERHRHGGDSHESHRHGGDSHAFNNRNNSTGNNSLHTSSGANHYRLPLPDISDISEATEQCVSINGEAENEIVVVERGVHKKSQNINVRAAMIHVIGDFIQSLGVLIAAIIIKVKPEYKIADPICTFLFSVLVLFTTAAVIRDIAIIIAEGVPRGLRAEDVRDDLRALRGVLSVHSLHIWALTMGKTAITVHLAVATDTDWGVVQRHATELLRGKHGFLHTTVQVEDYSATYSSTCDQCHGPFPTTSTTPHTADVT